MYLFLIVLTIGLLYEFKRGGGGGMEMMYMIL